MSLNQTPTSSLLSDRADAARIGDGALRREVNERIYGTGTWLAHGECIGRLEFLCECGLPGCELSAGMTLGEYAELYRQRGAGVCRSAVARDHEAAAEGFVVERRAAFVVVEQRAAET